MTNIDYRHSIEAYERAKRVMPGGNTRSSVFENPFPIYVKSGRGAYVRDVDGHDYLDFQNNFTALIHGYAHPETLAALTAAAGQGFSFAHPTTSEIDLAEVLCDRVGYFERIRFMNTGSEAVMMAVKAARAITGRSKIAKFEGAYHGNYDFVEVSFDPVPENWGQDAPEAVPYNIATPRSILDDVVVIPFNDLPGTKQILCDRRSELACVLIDPLPARVGLVPIDPSYLSFLRQFTEQHGILLLSDEVLSFRIGYGGALSRFGVEPDLCVFGKIIGGGLPIGAVAGRAGIMKVFDSSRGKASVSQSGTFTANPLSMAAGAASMSAMTAEVFEQLDDLGEYTRRRLREAIAESGVSAQVTGMGSLFRIMIKEENVLDYRSGFPSNCERDRQRRLIAFVRDNGVILSATGLGALSTPMTTLDIDKMIEIIGRGLQAVDSQVTK
ncbi:aminotransferase class III-fold pyridoxal phosphate-dependent enzyme [Pelagibius litoralis]|uniref:Aminotransferase class III-fold pyridoxal phosphate-dependent enzyme n=1 Tax=Pelagibius litoralis TaxID=374515 RepID=A0A967EZT6_9PROT|nr:aminotransferase class III-fold pyridoxal phosphate-dependent enzyme [Pelagibius litoralis]NIA70420.1 aminotransferase class III-fold pyridoxal phosphate-dependent enzyme [Pelagibius litoralis]